MLLAVDIGRRKIALNADHPIAGELVIAPHLRAEHGAAGGYATLSMKTTTTRSTRTRNVFLAPAPAHMGACIATGPAEHGCRRRRRRLVGRRTHVSGVRRRFAGAKRQGRNAR